MGTCTLAHRFTKWYTNVLSIQRTHSNCKTMGGTGILMDIREGVGEEAEQEETPVPKTPVTPTAPLFPMTGESDGKAYMEELKHKKQEKLREDLEEFEQQRREDKSKQEDEIEALKQKREERQKERVEEEKRLTVQRREEDNKRKAEEEERRQKKIEDERKRKEERERRRKDMESKQGPKTPNFTIVKGSGGQQLEDDDDAPPQKTKEELEQEKQAVLATRIQPLQIDNINTEKLKAATKELHEKLTDLLGRQYDAEERFKIQQYDMTELRERARQMSKTKKRGVSRPQVDDSYDAATDKFNHAPPRIQVANKFERNLDRRPWGDKLKCYQSKPKILICSKFERHTDSRSYADRLLTYEKLSANKPMQNITYNKYS